MSKLIRPFAFQDCMVLLGYFSLAAVQMINFALDPGVGWHLKTGEYILSNSAIPYHDPFLAFESVRPWISDQWFADLFLYILYAIPGESWALLYGVLTSIFLVTYFGVLYSGVSKITGSAIAASVSVMVAFKLGQIHFILRPVLFSFLFFAIVYVGLHSLYKAMRDPEDDSLSTRRILSILWIVFPLTFLVWANVHPTFALGGALLAIFIVALSLDVAILGRKIPEFVPLILQISLLTAVCAVITLINPYGYLLHESILTLGSSEYAMNFYMEWRPPNFRAIEGRVFLFSLAVIGCSFFLGGVKKQPWGMFEFLSVLAFAHLCFQFVRILPFFGIVVTIPLTYAICNFANAEIFTRYPLFKKLLQRLRGIEKIESRSYRGRLSLVVIICVLLFSTSLRGTVPLFAHELGPRESAYPYGAVSAIKAEAERNGPFTLVADVDWSGFMLLYAEGSVRPMIDDRNTLLGEKFYREYFKRLQPGGGWQEYLERFGTKYMLLRSDSAFSKHLKVAGLVEVLYEDDLCMFARKKEGEVVKTSLIPESF